MSDPAKPVVPEPAKPAAATKPAAVADPTVAKVIERYEDSSAGAIKYFLPDFGKCGAGVVQGLTGEPFWANTLAGLKGIPDSTVTGSEEWKHPWFDFLGDPALCLWAWCLPCAVVPHNYTAMVDHHFLCSGPGTAYWANPGCEAACIALMCCNCCGGLAANARTQLRRKYNIKGSTLEDWLLSCCCGCFLTCQHARELGERTTYNVPLTNVKGTGPAPTAPGKWPAAHAPVVPDGMQRA